MNNKALTESGWKAIVAKYKVKDNGLQRALADYARVDEDDHAEQLKAIARIDQVASALAKNKDVAASEDVVDYLEDVQNAAEAEEREITKAKVTADKSAALADKQDKQEDAYEAKLWAMLQKVKSGRGTSYGFLYCEGPERNAVILAPAIGAPHRQQLMQLTGGKRLFGPGTCRFEEGKFVFGLDRPASGMAKKLQLAILESTKRRLPIVVGAEAEDGDE